MELKELTRYIYGWKFSRVKIFSFHKFLAASTKILLKVNFYFWLSDIRCAISQTTWYFEELNPQNVYPQTFRGHQSVKKLPSKISNHTISKFSYYYHHALYEFFPATLRPSIQIVTIKVKSKATLIGQSPCQHAMAYSK